MSIFHFSVFLTNWKNAKMEHTCDHFLFSIFSFPIKNGKTKNWNLFYWIFYFSIFRSKTVKLKNWNLFHWNSYFSTSSQKVFKNSCDSRWFWILVLVTISILLKNCYWCVVSKCNSRVDTWPKVFPAKLRSRWVIKVHEEEISYGCSRSPCELLLLLLFFPKLWIDFFPGNCIIPINIVTSD